MDSDAPPHAQLVDLDSLDTPASNAVTLTEKETLVLRLWDQLRELELERAVLDAEKRASPSSTTEASQDALLAAQRDALDSRATYLLRNRITDQVITTDPIIKAVHTTNTSPTTSPNPLAPLNARLLPLIHTRDVLSLSHAQLTTALGATATELANASAAVTAANSRNRALAATLLELTAQKSKKGRGAGSVREYLDGLEQHPKTGGEGDNDDAMQGIETAHTIPDALKEELEAAEREMRDARRRWRVMKGVAAGVVVGSGVDWAEDEGLRGLVMGADDDEELNFEGEGVAMEQ